MIEIRIPILRAVLILSLLILGWSWQTPGQSSASKGATSASAAPAVSRLPEFHEDWTTLTLKNSDLSALKPTLGETDETAGNSFIRERYQMQWRPGDPLDIYVVRPKGVAKAPVILYLYSFPQDTDRFKNDHWCETVTSSGYAAVGFVSALTGHRIHDRPVKEWFVGELAEALATSTHDVQMILNYLASRSDLDMNHVGMFGVGSGGTIAILAAAADSRIKAIEVVSPWGAWPSWLAESEIVPESERATYLEPEFLAKVAPLDPVLWLPKITSAKIRLQDIRGTATTPDSSQKRIEAAAPSSAIVDEFADPRAFFPMSAGGRVFDWLKEQLQTNGTVSIAAYSPGVHAYSAGENSTLPSVPVPKSN